MTGSQKWLGHDDLCSIQWSNYCDCAGPRASSWTDELEELERAHFYDLERPFEQTLSDGNGDLG